MARTYTHVKCGKRAPWSGFHCAGCHESFVGLSAFDRHRKGGVCLIAPVTATPDSGKGMFWLDGDGWWHFGGRMSAEARARIGGGA